MLKVNNWRFWKDCPLKKLFERIPIQGGCISQIARNALLTLGLGSCELCSASDCFHCTWKWNVIRNRLHLAFSLVPGLPEQILLVRLLPEATVPEMGLELSILTSGNGICFWGSTEKGEQEWYKLFSKNLRCCMYSSSICLSSFRTLPVYSVLKNKLQKCQTNSAFKTQHTLSKIDLVPSTWNYPWRRRWLPCLWSSSVCGTCG